MVSQPTPASTSTQLVPRAPSSVISTSRSSRHRRQGRSHAGGSSFVPQNEFPVFSHTGDVEILISAGGTTNRYLLHRIILTQCSGFFEASTSLEWSRARDVDDGKGGELARIGEEGSARGESRDRGEVKKRWRYELDAGENGDDIPMLVQKEQSPTTQLSLFGPSSGPPPVRNKPPPSSSAFFRSVANLSISHPPVQPLSHEDRDLLNDYDNLFRIFYNYPPNLDAIDIATAYLQCKSLLNLADLYDALEVVGPRIDHHLLQFQSRLWKQIAKYPSSYLKLGYLARSQSIFKEALIHVVGNWPVGERHIRSSLPDSVLDLIEDKVEDLHDLTGKIEGRLFRLTLLTSRGERVTPHNSYLDWLVVSFFRGWLADNTSPPPVPPPRSREGNGRHTRNPSNSLPNTHHTNTTIQNFTPSASGAPHHNPSDSVLSSSSSQPTLSPSALGRVFRQLGAPGGGYLGHDEVKRFLKLSPENYSRDNLKRFERKLEDMKTQAREIVRPLMKCSLEGGGGGSTGYLTCVRVRDSEYPWLESSGER
jgi:hypothetical protein